MTRCPQCGRHHKETESSCPFCGRSRGRLGRLTRSATVAFSAVVLMACYGPPPGGWDSGEDGFDGDDDGSPVAEDCNDDDPRIYPEAVEICDDGLDNDCDTLTDGADTEDCATE